MSLAANKPNSRKELKMFNAITDERMTTAQAAQYLGIAKGTLAIWRYEKHYGLPYIKVGGRVFYRKEALNNWLESRTVVA